MPYEVATGKIQTAIRTLLLADATLTSLLATKVAARGGGPAIYNEGDVPLDQPFPYLTIGAWTQIPEHSLSPDSDGYGWNCTGQIKAVGQRSGDQLVNVLSAVLGVLPDGERITVTGYSAAFCAEANVQPELKEIIAGKTTYSLPLILRVYATP